MTQRPLRSPPEYVTVAMVMGASGSLGAIGCRPLTEFPERLLDLKRVRVSPAGAVSAGPALCEVLSAEKKGDVFVLQLDGITCRQQATALRGARLEIPADEVRPLPDGHYYRFEIVGLVVRDESGETLGVVRDVLDTGANDVYVVDRQGMNDDGGELLLPAIKEVVLDIDLTAGSMTVRPQRLWDGSQVSLGPK